MKKKNLLMAAALMLSSAAAHADEGMWTLYNLPQAVYEQMKSYGFSPSYDQLYKSDDAIKNAVVNFSGFCSGVVVSPDGLVFTNHHCGFEAIRANSTVEHDYMLNGFYAKSFEEELPSKNMFVSFMVDQQDITPELEKRGINSMDRKEREKLLNDVENEMIKAVHAKDPSLELEIKPFYEGNKYYATTYRIFRDLRLVFTVPKSMGKFGGETDNWMWPRQTCDYSVFRIYADPNTNGPAAYNKQNVPYHPKHWAQVSMDGYKEGDFAMTIGYPGSTERYLSSYGIREMRDAENAPRAQIRGVKQEVMIKHMRADEGVRIKYDSKYAQSSNYWKNSLGMNKCIDSVGIVRQKADFEDRIEEFQKWTGYLKGKLDFQKMRELYATRFDADKLATVWRETFARTSEFNTRALTLIGMMPKDSKKKTYYHFEDNSDEWDEALDKDVMAALIDNYRQYVKKEELPEFYKTIEGKFAGDSRKYVDYLYKNSVIMKSGKKITLTEKALAKDPGYQYAKAVKAVYDKCYVVMSSVYDAIEEQEKYLCDAKVRYEQELPHYSDANFTMRLSYGQVGGYLLNGEPSGYYTDAASIVRKMESGEKGTIDYQAEPIMKKLLSANDFGKYADKTTGKMQLCFLTNNDITGGNSGSPMFDGKGRLIGLAFDGNWDSLSSDIWFDKRLARCIGVDVRYMIYLMDKWGNADRLIKELGLK
ncbi:S46 family peptidase [Prevotella sp.]|uniref:S46 family peptidase n=1 Tax=Prevotella sp. TaxID=59823 RepID=UPI0025FA842E|nr:S46 family peptidase [Prevotella sp.]